MEKRREASHYKALHKQLEAHIASEKIWREMITRELKVNNEFHQRLTPLVEVQDGLIAFSRFVIKLEAFFRPLAYIVVALSAVIWAVTDGARLFTKWILHIKGGS